jgi:hypothetical protein
MLTDGQFGILASVLTVGLGAIAAAIRFGVSRVVTALDVNSQAMIANTASNAVLSTKIDAITEYIHRERPTPVEGVPTTTAGQYLHVRPKTEPGRR